MENDTQNIDASALIARINALEAEKAASEAKARQLLDEKKKQQASFEAEKEDAAELLARNLAGVVENQAKLQATTAELEANLAQAIKKATEAERKAALVEAGITGPQLELAMLAIDAKPAEYVTEAGLDVTKLVTKYQSLVSEKPKQTTPQPVAGGANISNAVVSFEDAKARYAQSGNLAEFVDFVSDAAKKRGATRT